MYLHIQINCLSVNRFKNFYLSKRGFQFTMGVAFLIINFNFIAVKGRVENKGKRSMIHFMVIPHFPFSAITLFVFVPRPFAYIGRTANCVVKIFRSAKLWHIKLLKYCFGRFEVLLFYCFVC